MDNSSGKIELWFRLNLVQSQLTPHLCATIKLQSAFLLIQYPKNIISRKC